jgi:aspartate/methionine/tyrosine aminotransferase
MFPSPRYLEWARRFYGQVPFDLASSGISSVALAELGELPRLDDPKGWPPLVEAISRYNGVPQAEVAPALGTTYALWLAYATLLRPGDEVIVEAPSYEPLWRIAEGVGATVVRFERTRQEGFRLDPERVAQKMTARTRIVAVSNLHNPSGARVSDEVLREVARVAATRSAYLLVDEVYAPFDGLVGGDGVWGQSARRLAPNILAASSLTKCFGLGQQRIGWLLGPPEAIAAALGTILATAGHFPQEHASLGARAFARLPSLATRATNLMGTKRERVRRWATARNDLTWSEPESGLFGFATCVRPEDLTARIEAAAQHDGILVAPGAFFGVPNGFRLSWSIATELLDEGLERLGRVLAH